MLLKMANAANLVHLDDMRNGRAPGYLRGSLAVRFRRLGVRDM
jgi:hypothetical protein